MKQLLLLAFFTFLLSVPGYSQDKNEAKAQYPLERLLNGNKRYVANKSEHPIALRRDEEKLLQSRTLMLLL